jgi:hypothetical protein
MTVSNVRVVGSNYTVFRWMGKPIAYLEGVQDGGTAPVAQVEEIHSLGDDHPSEFAVPRAMGSGRLTFTIRELWDKPVWQHLAGLASAQNILDVWRLLSENPTANVCQTIIRPPTGNFVRVKTYHNVVISAIDDSESIQMATMSIARSVAAVYTHATRDILTA